MQYQQTDHHTPVHMLTCESGDKRERDQMLIQMKRVYDRSPMPLHICLDLRALAEMQAFRLAQQLRLILEQRSPAAKLALVLAPEVLDTPDSALHTIHEQQRVHYFTDCAAAQKWLNVVTA